MTALQDRLALLLKEFRKWDPTEPCPATARELAQRYGLELGTVLRIARSEGFNLKEEELAPLELTDSDIEVVDDESDEVRTGSIMGRYELLEKLGEGGMGVVYVAYDPALNRRIAIKFLRTDISSEVLDEDPQDARRRILREAQAMAQVSKNPNIVPIYDVGTFNKRVFIAMEYVEGRPINDFIETKRLGWKQVRSLYLQAARGLMAAHDLGLVHRDFKPDNVLVDNEYQVKVMDFGLARPQGNYSKSNSSVIDLVKNVENLPLLTSLTVTGQVMGTPAYMAPEQFLLEEVDGRTDQFAFCVSFYEALTGYRPFQADSFRDLTRKVMNNRIVEPPRDSDAPEWIFDTLRKGLSVKKSDRWTSMKHLCEALLEEPPHVKAAAKKKMRRTVILVVGSFFAFAGTGSQVWVMTQSNPTDVEPSVLTSVPNGVEVPYGTYTPRQIHQVIMANSQGVQRCYKEILRESPETIGRVEVSFSIGQEGQVKEAHITKDTIKHKRLADCVTASTLFWKFPATKSFMDTKVTYPFVFSPPKG